MLRYRTIVAPVDSTDLTDRAVDAAFALAVQHAADVWVLWCRPEPDVDATRVETDLDEVEQLTRTLLAFALARVRGRFDLPEERVHVRVRGGDATGAILDTVDALQADLVVMGTHGRHGLVDAVLGSTTERVLRRTPADVLVVKPLGFPDQVE
jgi:nucleotide-binding universal stress UspA family protein